MPERLSPQHVKVAAQRFGVEAAALQAVAVVESSGSGFLPNGWLKILFERHILYRQLQANGRNINPQVLMSQRPDLCNPNPGGYLGNMREWDRVNAILAWAREHAPAQAESYRKAAYESCSWGMFQLMGMNHAAAGFPNVDVMIQAFQGSEQAHLESILRWMANHPQRLLALLNAHDWANFARYYNGPGNIPIYAPRLAHQYQLAKQRGW